MGLQIETRKGNLAVKVECCDRKVQILKTRKVQTLQSRIW